MKYLKQSKFKHTTESKESISFKRDRNHHKPNNQNQNQRIKKTNTTITLAQSNTQSNLIRMIERGASSATRTRPQNNIRHKRQLKEIKNFNDSINFR